MIEVEAIREIYGYNRWANAKVFEAVAPLAADQFVENLGGSFPSIRDTLTHIVSAEWIWLERWRGRSPRALFAPADFPRSEILETRWREIEADQRAFLETLTSERLAATVSYVNLQGQTWRYALWREMVHVVNHSSYHRGQVTNMLRRLGARPVPTDFLVFHDEIAGSGDS